MKAFKTTLITSIGAFLIGTVSPAPRLALSTKVINSSIKPGNAPMSRVGFALARVDRAQGDPDAPVGYSPLWIATINGRLVKVYVFQNGAKLDDAAGQGHGFAEVFDRAGHLTRRFIFRENLNSPPQIIEFFYIPER
jgi:hypothetical protein